MASTAGPSRKIFNDGTLSSFPETSLSILSSEVYEQTSTLQYVNSQLVAHGFARSPGLSLDGLANEDSERVVRCILAMLSQRMDDLGRTEELGSRLRTISYEHERLQSMHRAAVDTGANAEREMNLFKTKMAASQRALASEVSAHKQTLSELQRTRTSLQFLRSTTQNELKRKDREVERVLERWNKVSDAQIKLTHSHSGLRCANLAVGGDETGKGKGLMEEALDQAEDARKELVRENEGFRSVILSTANALQGMVYNVKTLATDVHVEEPISLSHTAVFAPPTSSLPHPDNALIKLRELMAAFREALSGIPTSSTSASAKATDTEEATKLKDLVKSLRDELAQARQSSSTLATRAQEVLDKFTTHASERLITGRDPTPKEAAEISMELIGVLERDELRETLDKRAMKLQAERDRFTEATLKLGREKAALETERLKLLEEKRRWAVDQMLAELPPTPGPDSDLVSPLRPINPTVKQLSPSPPRVHPRKVSGSKGTSKSPSKKTVSKRTLASIACVKPESLSPKKRSLRRNATDETIDVLYEPDIQHVGSADSRFQRSTTPEDSPPITPPAAAATLLSEMKTSLPLVLPTTFTLPPPSPASSLAALDLGSISSNTSMPQASSSSAVPSFDAIPLVPNAAPPVISLPRPHIFPSPRTPRPLVNTHVKHAYSPARPSPLSRILMIADSPPSPPSASPREEVKEETKGMSTLESSTKPVISALPKRFLTRVDNLEEPIDEPSPLRERIGADPNGPTILSTRVAGTGENIPTSHREKGFRTREKGKGRAVPDTNRVPVMEKENVATLTKESRASKTKFNTVNRGIATTRVKSSKAAGLETRNAELKTNYKPPSINDINDTATRTGTSSGGGAPEASAVMKGVNMVRAGRARRVHIGTANVGKMGGRKV